MFLGVLSPLNTNDAIHQSSSIMGAMLGSTHRNEVAESKLWSFNEFNPLISLLRLQQISQLLILKGTSPADNWEINIALTHKGFSRSKQSRLIFYQDTRRLQTERLIGCSLLVVEKKAPNTYKYKAGLPVPSLSCRLVDDGPLWRCSSILILVHHTRGTCYRPADILLEFSYQQVIGSIPIPRSISTSQDDSLLAAQVCPGTPTPPNQLLEE